jgi:heme/copper-type cytochrome/quinol oxidase subunit 1
MHWLGLNGMPRRIPDYPDGYIGWNHVISLGSILTFISLIIFFYVVSVTVFNPRTAEINNK